MRKLSLVLCVFVLLSCLCLCALAVENTATMRWDDEVSTNLSSGYPRMAQRADGRLLMTTDGGALLYSDDKGATWTKHSTRIVANASTKINYTKDGTTYSIEMNSDSSKPTISRANFQPFVLEDGTVLLGYRFHTTRYTEGDPFYTSIRVMYSTDGGMTYANEEILVEDLAYSSNGFWEPYFVQIDENTIACYYADDLNVYKSAQQRIAYVTYDIPTKTWDKTPKVAIYRGGQGGMSTRDGMPMVATLSDGSFAMVVEAQDFARWINTETNSTFVVGLSLSKDGRTWSDPVPVFGPKDLKAGKLCAAPSIAALPDGRIIITCQTDDSYTGSYGTEATYKRAMGVAISDAPITADTVLTAIDHKNPKADGAAVGFTRLENVFNYGENVYSVWNAAFNSGNDIYLLGTAGTNTESGSRTNNHIRLRHLTAFANENEVASYDNVADRAGENKFSAAYGTAKNGTVTLGVPMGIAANKANVYRMDGGVYLTKMDVTAENGALTFTDDGGYYAISDKELVNYGDATGDGVVGIKDAIRILKQISANVDGTDIAACDMNGSLSIDIADVLAVVRKVIG